MTTIVTDEDLEQMFEEYIRNHEQRDVEGMTFSDLINYPFEYEGELDEERMVFRKRRNYSQRVA